MFVLFYSEIRFAEMEVTAQQCRSRVLFWMEKKRKLQSDDDVCGRFLEVETIPLAVTRLVA